VNTFNGKLDFKVAHYETVAGNSTVNNMTGGLNALADMMNTLVDQNYGGLNVGNPQGIKDFENWLNSPNGQIYRAAFNYSFVPNTDPNRPVATYGSYADASGSRGLVAGVSALKSTGWEYELTFNPTRNWRISANAASQEAVRTNVAPELRAFLFGPDSLLNLLGNTTTPTAFGALKATGAGNTASFVYLTNVINNGPLKEFAQEGAKNDELAPWRFSMTTNYTLNPEWFGGRLKGWGVGGAMRWSDRRLLGYAGRLATVGTQSVAALDPSKPYWSKTETTFDAWISYTRKLAHGMTWKAQFNLRNIGVGNELRPLYAQPDGQVVQWTIREAQRWTLSSSFAF